MATRKFTLKIRNSQKLLTKFQLHSLKLGTFFDYFGFPQVMSLGRHWDKRNSNNRKRIHNRQFNDKKQQVTDLCVFWPLDFLTLPFCTQSIFIPLVHISDNGIIKQHIRENAFWHNIKHINIFTMLNYQGSALQNLLSLHILSQHLYSYTHMLQKNKHKILV